MKKIIAIILTLTLISALFSGCSGSSKAYDNTASYNMAATAPAAPAASAAPLASSRYGLNMTAAQENAAVEDFDLTEASPVPPPTGGGIAGPAVNPVVDSRKIIKNVSMQLQTLYFDRAINSISQLSESFGGYIQDSYVEGRDMYNERGTRTANFTIRVPSETLDSFVNSFGGDEFNVISKSQNSEDITESYYDSKARLDALKVQEERLMAMLEKAEQLEYLLQVERELMNVRYEIESLSSSLKRLDSYVSLSTVNIFLREVVKYEHVEDIPVTFGERVSRAFSSSWKNFSEFSQNFAVVFISVFPFLLLLFVIVLVILLIVRRSIKKSDRKPTTARTVPVYVAPSFNTAPTSDSTKTDTPDDKK